MKTPLVISSIRLIPVLLSFQSFAQSNIERAIVYELNKIRAASCLDSLFYSPEISASCREKAKKIYNLGNAPNKETEEQSINEFSERFHRYMPKRYQKVLACITGKEFETSSFSRHSGYPDDVAAKEIASSLKKSLLNSPEYSYYLNHKSLERKIGISVIPDKNKFDIIVVSVFTGGKDGLPTITPAWKPVIRNFQQTKTAEGSKKEIHNFIREGLDSISKNANLVEVKNARQLFHQLIMEGYQLKFEDIGYEKYSGSNHIFRHFSSQFYYTNNPKSKGLCYYSIQKEDGVNKITVISGAKASNDL